MIKTLKDIFDSFYEFKLNIFRLNKNKNIEGVFLIFV